jgi:hypothetical protein
MTSSRLSIWAVCCGGCAVVCLLVVAIAVTAAVLPVRWVGHPFVEFVEWLHPGTDAPDNWALAFTYFARLVSGLLALATILLLVANPRFWARALADAASASRRKGS